MDSWYEDGGFGKESEWEAQRRQETDYLTQMCAYEGHPVVILDGEFAYCECGRKCRRLNGLEIARLYLKGEKNSSQG